MITKHDWDHALDRWIAGERERLGGPPSPEEVVAFTRGELPPRETARVRALLVYYPELTSLLDDAIPPQQTWRYARIANIAAAFVIAVLSILLVQQVRQNREPFAYASRHTLDLRTSRGSALPQIYVLPANEEQYLLDVLLAEDLPYRAYRVDIFDMRRSDIVWSTSDLRAPFSIAIRRTFLRPGTYRMDVYGIANGKAESVQHCWLRAR
ncbi:MAG: hypothetical protein DMF56_23610 [Acidobacteria bacterium]|nr:MAG: hypothetical protein DMF56_23610 [Acidobacteriota bacterium]